VRLWAGHGRPSSAPAGVDGPVVYGPNLRAIAVYLVVFQHVPVERAALLITDLTGAAVSTGWVSAQVARTGDALVQAEALITTLVSLAVVIAAPEPGAGRGRRVRDLAWLHRNRHARRPVGV